MKSTILLVIAALALVSGTTASTDSSRHGSVLGRDIDVDVIAVVDKRSPIHPDVLADVVVNRKRSPVDAHVDVPIDVELRKRQDDSDPFDSVQPSRPLDVDLQKRDSIEEDDLNFDGSEQTDEDSKGHGNVALETRQNVADVDLLAAEIDAVGAELHTRDLANTDDFVDVFADEDASAGDKRGLVIDEAVVHSLFDKREVLDQGEANEDVKEQIQEKRSVATKVDIDAKIKANVDALVKVYADILVKAKVDLKVKVATLILAKIHADTLINVLANVELEAQVKIWVHAAVDALIQAHVDAEIHASLLGLITADVNANVDVSVTLAKIHVWLDTSLHVVVQSLNVDLFATIVAHAKAASLLTLDAKVNVNVNLGLDANVWVKAVVDASAKVDVKAIVKL